MMPSDFTLEKYSGLITELAANYRVMMVGEYLVMPPPEDSVAVLFHPVTGDSRRAARMALAEKRLGVRSTYYFGWDPEAVNWAGTGDGRYGNFPELAVVEAKLYGHEAGYIPGADDAARLRLLRKLAPVRTSLTELDDPDILGGPYSGDFSEFFRVENVGKRWSGFRTTGAVMEMLGSGNKEKILISVAPDAWK